MYGQNLSVSFLGQAFLGQAFLGQDFFCEALLKPHGQGSLAAIVLNLTLVI
jgi:hypothetical protein